MKPEIIEKNGDCEISINYLKRIGIPEERINQGIRNYLDGNSSEWKCNHLTIDNEIYLFQSNLPRDIQTKFENAQTLVVTTNNRSNNLLGGLHQLDLKLAYEKGYKDFLGEYLKISNSKSRKRHARKHAVLLKALDIYLELGCKKSSILKIYNTLRVLRINYYTTPESFRRKFRQVRLSDNFAEEVLHKICTLKKHPAQKVDDWTKLKITDLMGQGKLKTVILEEINQNRPLRKQISYATLLKYITQEVKNITAEKRYGYDFYKKHLEPYIRRQKPKFKYQVVEADGSRLQLPYRNELNKIKFLKIYVIIDLHSSLILGFSLGEEENTEMIMLAFSMVFERHRYVPACVLTDKSKPHMSANFQRFKSDCNLFFNAIWREHLPDFPNAKGTVENFFRNFHIQVVRKYFGYFGLGMTAKSNEHKLNKDELKKIEKNRHLLKTRQELILFVGTLINEWNNRITKEMSPLQKHNNAPIMDAQPIKEEFIARLCWNKAERLIKRCKIHLGSYEYDLEQNENRIKWNGELVDVYYHSSKRDHLYLFKDNAFIEKVHKKRFYSEESGSKFQKIAQNKSLRKYANVRYDENKETLEKMENDDPVIGVINDADKNHSNENYEKFLIENYLSDSELEKEDPFESQELPELNI
tara:strand:- start:1232 stop:3157 length:1926 start_codon:yes stop_codon:yes gene_type:complete